MPSFSVLNRLMPWLVLLPWCLAGCALPVIDEAERLSRAGHYEQALAQLNEALHQRPDDASLRTAYSRQRDRLVMQALARADMAIASGRLEEADRLLQRARELDPQQPRLAVVADQLALARQAHERRAAQRDAAVAAVRAPVAVAALPPALSAAYQKPVSLEFKEAPLRQVFEVLARSTGVNFVFDKDVRGETKVTVFLRQVTLDEALRVILATQQLDRKLLNDSTVLVYPNTAAKQREHQELVTRSLYLVNAEAKQLLTLVRTMTKTRDLYVDERLNALVVRDTPEVVRQVEQLIATLDLPEPEVLLAVEVMEVASDRLDSLGLNWPGSVQWGLPGASGPIALGDWRNFRTTVAQPALAATLTGDSGSTNLLANPTIRARNHEKAKVQIGEKLPVFTTTSAINVGVSTTVTYIDVGLKLDVEPSIALDGDVTIKVALEVTNLLGNVSGPGGSLAYRVGTRMTTTSLRLQDGQTQVLAGLINDEDRQRAVGVPGMDQMPVVGKLFGVQTDTRNKTEIVMMITPHIVRQLHPPAQAMVPSGTDAQPGANPLRLKNSAKAAVGPSRGGAAPLAGAQADPAPAAPAAETTLVLSATPQAKVGDTVSVTLSNRSGLRLTGVLAFDGESLKPATAGAAAGGGPLAFDLPPRGESVVVLRVLPAAAGQTLLVQAQGVSGVDAQGQAAALGGVEGEASIQVAGTTALPPVEVKP